jgi:hypothetical protein
MGRHYIHEIMAGMNYFLKHSLTHTVYTSNIICDACKIIKEEKNAVLLAFPTAHTS